MQFDTNKTSLFMVNKIHVSQWLGHEEIQYYSSEEFYELISYMFVNWRCYTEAMFSSAHTYDNITSMVVDDLDTMGLLK